MDKDEENTLYNRIFKSLDERIENTKEYSKEQIEEVKRIKTLIEDFRTRKKIKELESKLSEKDDRIITVTVEKGERWGVEKVNAVVETPEE